MQQMNSRSNSFDSDEAIQNEVSPMQLKEGISNAEQIQINDGRDTMGQRSASNVRF